MNLPLKFARRYLFGKKSTQAINIISGISVFGLSVGTAAILIILSVFNGFEELLTGLFASFNPDVKIVAVEGKVFDSDPEKLAQLRALPMVKAASETLEEIAYFEYGKQHDFGRLKGVDQYYEDATKVDSMVREGTFLLQDGDRYMAILGVGMRNKLSVDVGDDFSSLSVYMAKRKKVGPMGKPFKKRFLYPSGTFVIQQEYDNQYVFCSLDFARDLMDRRDVTGAIEIRLADGANSKEAVKEIEAIMGPEFEVKDRYRQDEAFLKLMNMEKWIAWAILSLAIVLVAFNLIGSLWMIVLEKRKDISILKSMGAQDYLVRNIFLSEGLLLSGIGLLLGLFMAGLFCFALSSFGIFSIPAIFIIASYPISMRWEDVFVVSITVLTIGLVASLLPANRASKVLPIDGKGE